MKWHPDKNQGDALGILSVYRSCSNAHLLPWLASGMCCMRILLQGLTDCCMTCADKVDLATKKFKVSSCLPRPAHLYDCF